MNLGYVPGRLVPDADAIVVIECDVPWISSQVSPDRDCKVIQCGLDPLFGRYPIRNFTCDLAITGTTVATLAALTAALEPKADADAVEARRRRISELRKTLTAGWKAAIEGAAHKHPLDPAWVSHCIDRAKDPSCIVINEYTLFISIAASRSRTSTSDRALRRGWDRGAGAALGAKLARPDRRSRPWSAMARMFSNPAAVHHAAALLKLPCCSWS